MLNCAEVSRGQASEMQLAGRLAVSAAALLLLTLVYRYYKTLGSPRNVQKGGDGGAGANQNRKPKLSLIGDRAEKEETCLGLRHREVKRNELIKGAGSQAPGKSGLEGGPPGREKSEEIMSDLGTDSQTHQQGLDPEEDEKEEGRTGGTLLSGARVPVGISVTKLETNLDFLGSCSPRVELCSSESDQDGPSGNFCLSPYDNQQVGRGAQLTSLERGNRHLLDGGEGLTRHPGWTAEVQLQKKGIQSFQAMSNVSLSMSQSHLKSSAAYTFSSVAQVQVEEKLIQERRSMEINDGQAKPSEGNLRGKVYDYYVQSTSQSIMKKKPSDASLGTPQSYRLSKTDTCNESEMLLYHEGASSISEDTDNRDDLLKASSTSPDAPEDDIKSMPAEDQKGMATEENPTQMPPELGYRLRRKDSFHKIMENPELQVPMEGFGSSTSGPSEVNTSSLVHLRSNCVSSLLGSMKTTQSDTKEEPMVELVAGAKFLHLPLSSESLGNILHLDLGNCYEVLHMAKKQKLKDLQEAAYKVMSDNYLQVLRTNAIYGRLNAMERDLILQQRMRGKKYLTVADINSQEHGGSTSRLCYYDDQKDTWHPLAHMPIEAVSRGCTICTMFNYLFVVAGCEGRGRHQRPSNRVFCYNPLTNIWREIRPLNQARPHCKLVALDGYLFAIGGECLYTVECYDPRTDRWSFAAPLPNNTFAVAHTATVCDGEIYVTGGTLRYMLLRYIPRLDAWKVSLTGGNKDRTTEMVAVNCFLYRFDLNQSMGIGVYRCGSRAKLWYECATHPMPFPSYFQCAVVENLIYCISHQFNIHFLADPVSPRFGTKELQNFPSPRGTLLPVTLVLPAGDAVQTRV